MESGPFIDEFPIKTTIYRGFSMAMLNNQMVNGMKAGHLRSMNSFALEACKIFIRPKSRSHSLQFFLCIEFGLELSQELEQGP